MWPWAHHLPSLSPRVCTQRHSSPPLLWRRRGGRGQGGEPGPCARHGHHSGCPHGLREGPASPGLHGKGQPAQRAGPLTGWKVSRKDGSWGSGHVVSLVVTEPPDLLPARATLPSWHLGLLTAPGEASGQKVVAPAGGRGVDGRPRCPGDPGPPPHSVVSPQRGSPDPAGPPDPWGLSSRGAEILTSPPAAAARGTGASRSFCVASPQGPHDAPPGPRRQLSSDTVSRFPAARRELVPATSPLPEHRLSSHTPRHASQKPVPNVGLRRARGLPRAATPAQDPRVRASLSRTCSQGSTARHQGAGEPGPSGPTPAGPHLPSAASPGHEGPAAPRACQQRGPAPAQ